MAKRFSKTAGISQLSIFINTLKPNFSRKYFSAADS